MTDYSKMTDSDFDRILCEVMADFSVEALLHIPGAYEVFAEYFNNDVLDQWRSEQEQFGEVLKELKESKERVSS